MDEKYLQDLYNWIKTKDASYEGRYSYQDFASKMQDTDYSTKMHQWISTKDETFSQRHPIDKFISEVGGGMQQPAAEKKNLIPTPQPQGQGTTEPVLGGGLLESPLPPVKQPKPAAESTALGVPNFEAKKMEQAQRELAPKFRKSLDTITPDLISGTEENAVPLMNYHFGDMGFKFEESGMSGDWMTVTSPTGKKTEVSLDNWFSDKDKSEAEKLRLFIQNNLGENGAGIIKQFEAQPMSKFKDEEDIKKSMKTVNDEFNSMIQEKNSIVKQNELIDKTFRDLNAIPVDQRDATWMEQYNQANADKQSVVGLATNLENKRASSAQREAQIQSAAGKYMSMKGEQGTWYGNIYNQALDAVGKALAGAVDIEADMISFVDGIVNPPNRKNKEKYRTEFIELAKKQGIQVPELKTNAEFEDWKNSIAFGDVRRDEIDKQIQENNLKRIKQGEGDGKGALNMARNGLRAIAGDPNTTVEYTDLSKEGFWGGVIGGLIDFAPAMIGPGWVKAATMFAISNDNMKKEFEQNPELKDLSESDKMMYALPFNIANSVLLEFGLNRVMANKSLVANLVTAGMERAGAKATAAELKNIMKGEVENMIARGAVDLGKGMVSGAELGVAIYSTDVAIRKTINAAKEKKMFETPKDVSEFLVGAGKSAASLAMGAGILHIVPAVRAAAAETGYKAMPDNTFKMFEAAANNDEIQSALIASIKNKISAGEITKAQGEEMLTSYQNSVGLFKSVPDGLDTRAKKEAMDLLKERKRIEDKIQGKDAALVKPQQERIAKINEELNKLTEDAIQKQRADESLLRAGEERLGLRQVGEGDTQLKITPEQEKLVNDEKEHYQEILDNPDKYDEGDVQDANDYFADPIAFQENRVKFWEDLAKEDPTEQGTLDFVKARLEAHKAAEVKPAVEVTEVAKTTDELKKNYQALLDQMIQKRKELISSGVKESEVDNNPELLAIRAKAIEASKAMTEAAKGTTVTVGAGEATATSTGGPTEVTMGGEGTVTATSTMDLVKTKKNEDNEHIVTINGKEIGKMYYDPSQKTWQNANFNRQQAKPNSFEWIYGDILGESKQQAIDELIKRQKEAAPKEEPQKEEPQKVQYAKDNILNRFLNKLNSLNPLQKNPIDNKSFVYGDKASLEFNRFDKGDKNEVSVESISSLDKGKGIGKDVMKDVTDAADALGITLTLDAKPFGKEGLNKKQLIEFYKKNGFTVDLQEAFGGEFKTEQELIDYVLENESEALPMRREPKVEPTPEPITIKAGGGIGVSEAGATEITTAKGLETKTSGIEKLPGYEKVMDEVDFLVPKAKESVEKDLKKAKERYRVNKTEANKTKLDKAKAEYEEYKNDVVEARKKAMDMLEQSDTYKNSDDIQKNALAVEVAKRFGERQKTAPKPEELFGNVTETAKVMEELNFLFDYANKSKDFLDEKYKKAKEAFDNNPTSEALKRNLEKAKAEVEEYRTKNIDEAIAKLKETETYKKANAEQQAKMEKYLTDKFLKSQKTSILPTELFKNITDTKNITVSQKTAWADQLKTYIRGIKNQAEATKNVMKEVGERVSELVGKGKITTKQAEQIVKKLTSLKVFNAKAVDKFIDYASKVFKDAEYNSKLTTANDLRKSISKLSGAKEKNPFLRKLGKDFAKIKTSMVENIDAYNEMAAKIKESLRGSKIDGGKGELTPAEMVKISEAREYIDKVMEAQETALYEEKLAEVQEAMGVDASDLTFEQIVEMLREDKPIDKEKETIIRDAIKKYFDMNSTIIKDIFEKGKDPFTGEDMEISAEDKALVKKFMGMDLDLLDLKQQVEAIDQLSNFLQNGTTANMETVVRRYQGEKNIRQAAKEKLVASKLKQYWSPRVGEWLAQQVSTLPNLFEKMFKGTSKGARIEELSGITELKNAKTFVQMVTNKMTNDFVKQFYERKANGKEFDSESNILERGIIADAKRNIVGTAEQQKAEFEGNKKNIQESIEALRNGSEKEQKLAELYQEAYDKLLEGSNSAEDVINKSDKNNVEAVDWWIDKWNGIYDQLADVSENVYNEILDKDLNYTPRRFTQLSETGDVAELGTDQSLFNGNNADGSVYKKKTGVLEKTKKEKGLPKDKSGTPTRYRDLSFDKNNANAMYDALMDIHTAGAIRQVESFFKSDMLKKIVPSFEDRKILFNRENKGIGTGRVQDFVRNIRNKEIVSNSETSKILRKLNVVSSIGTASALGGLTQPLKQVAPVAINTLINTGGKLDIRSYFSKPKNDFLNRIGYGISTRGIESQAQISSINKMVDLASKYKGQKLLDFIEKNNRRYLDALLVSPDVAIARASWISYYEKALKKQDIDPKSIDYETHEVNKEAADYAQRMVDRQQNISDSDLQGKLLGTKDNTKQFFLRVVMPFASFRLNQTMRAMSDVATLTASKEITSKQDRAEATRSLIGYSAEMAVFKLIAYQTAMAIGSFTNYLIDRDESDEDYEKRADNMFRGQITGTVTDVLSPLPSLDPYIAKGADKFLDMFQEYVMDMEDDEKFKLMTMSKTDLIKNLGGLGIAPGKIVDLWDLAALAATGEFKDEYGRTKYISENNMDALKNMVPISLLSNLGLLPSEGNTIVRNAMKFAKKDSSTKEGGKEKAESDKMMQREEKEEQKSEKNSDELSALNKMLEDETDAEKAQAIQNKIDELSEPAYKTKEERAARKEELAAKKAEMDELLQDYDTKAEMKRYDPELYEKTFGEGSPYYEAHKLEMEVEKEMNKEKRKQKDEEMGYTPKKKEKGRYRREYRSYNSDGSRKRTYRTY